MSKSSIITDKNMHKKRLPPIHPGEILLKEFLKPMGISQYRLAKDIRVPARRINEIVLGKRAMSPDTALRLARYFSLSERFWLNLQARYDLEMEKDRLQGPAWNRRCRSAPSCSTAFRKFHDIGEWIHGLRSQ